MGYIHLLYTGYGHTFRSLYTKDKCFFFLSSVQYTDEEGDVDSF